jgi:hypothetical protein
MQLLGLHSRESAVSTGVREVGVLKYQSCLIGSGQYQEALIKECGASHRKIEIGFSAAPNDVLIPAMYAFGKKVFPSTIGWFGSQKGGIEVVKGNAPAWFYEQNPFQGSRYSVDQ